MEKKKTIKINKPTHSSLSNLGKKGETYDKIISKLIDNYKKGDKKC